MGMIYNPQNGQIFDDALSHPLTKEGCPVTIRINKFTVSGEWTGWLVRDTGKDWRVGNKDIWVYGMWIVLWA